MTAKDDIIEALHGAFEVEFQLAGILIVEFIRCLHGTHFVNPTSDA